MSKNSLSVSCYCPLPQDQLLLSDTVDLLVWVVTSVVFLHVMSHFDSFPHSILFFKFIYLWLHWVFVAVHGLSLAAASGGYSSLWCTGFSLWWLLLLQSMGSRHTGFSSSGLRALEGRLSSCGAWAQLLHGMWDLPRPGIEPMSPALAGRFLTTVPPGQSQFSTFFLLQIYLLIFIFGCVGSSLLHVGFLQLQPAGATLCCGAWASHCGGFSCCRARALGTWASVVVAQGLSSCGARTQLLRSMWDLPGPELEPVSPALAGRFLTTVPPGKPPIFHILKRKKCGKICKYIIERSEVS